MLNLSDKDLDRLSREAAGQFEIDENISSWEKLEQELDKEIGTISNNPIPPRSGLVAVSYVTLAILLVGLSIFLFRNDKNNKVRTLNNNITSAPSNKRQGSSSPALSSKQVSEMTQADKNKLVATKINLPASSSSQKASSPLMEKTQLDNSRNLIQQKSPETTINPASTEAENRSTAQGSTRTTKDVAAYGLQKSAQDKYKTNNTASRINHSNKQTVLPTSVDLANPNNMDSGQSPAVADEADKNLSNKLSGNAKYKNSKSVGGAVNPADERLKTIRLPSVESVAVFNQKISDSSLLAFTSKANIMNTGVAQSGKKNQQSLHINRSLHIGILVAPDFTNVGNAYNDKMSSNFGLTLGYHLFNNFSVNTGLIFTRKNYSANGYDFHSQNQWFNMIQLDYIQGSCNMLEIPLTFRYDYSTIGKTKFFINGGLSSYLMRHESYVYYYHANGYSGKTMKDYDDHDNYLFSTVSLSIGVEQQISNSLSLQVEPFVKLPFSGIGYGNLQLNSYGLGFSLRYSPVLGKSRH